MHPVSAFSRNLIGNGANEKQSSYDINDNWHNRGHLWGNYFSVAIFSQYYCLNHPVYAHLLFMGNNVIDQTDP
jgi:hypothetical protein